jgi:hypothetical protein
MVATPVLPETHVPPAVASVNVVVLSVKQRLNPPAIATGVVLTVMIVEVKHPDP